MSWLIIPLAIQTMVGVALSSRSVSLNKWEEGEGVNSSADWLTLGTGVIFLVSAGLGWYNYAHNRTLCWALTGLPVLKLCLDVVGLVLLYFIWFPLKPTPTTEGLESD